MDRIIAPCHEVLPFAKVYTTPARKSALHRVGNALAVHVDSYPRNTGRDANVVAEAVHDAIRTTSLGIGTAAQSLLLRCDSSCFAPHHRRTSPFCHPHRT